MIRQRTDSSFLRASIVAASVALGQQVFWEGLASRTDEGLAVRELKAEPRDVRAFEDGIQPERNLRQFDGDGIEVHTKDVIVGQAHFHPLPVLPFQRD